MTHLCFEADMSLRWTGWRKRLLVAIWDFRMLNVSWSCWKETKGYTFICRLLSLRWTVAPLGSICRALLCRDVTNPATGKGPSLKPSSCIWDMYIFICLLLRFFSVLLVQTELVENCSGHVVPTGVERSYRTVKGKGRKPQTSMTRSSKAYLFLHQGCL